MFIGKGIPISTGFDLNSQSPLDNRTIFKTIAERDSLPNINLYEGLECFVEDTKVKYQYLNGQWKEIEIWDNVIAVKDDTTNKLILSFYSNNILKQEVEIDMFSTATSDDLVEFRIIIDNMQATIDTLTNEIDSLKARVSYLEENQGTGTVSYTIITKDGDTIITKDGDIITTK